MEPAERSVARLLTSLRAAGARSKEELARLAASIRSWDRYLRMRIAVLGSFAVLSVLAIGIARSGGADEADNSLHAYLALRDSALGWALLVHNRSEEPWTDVVLELEGGHVHRMDRVDPDQKLVLSPWQFVREDGEAAPRTPPRVVTLRVGKTVIRPALSRQWGSVEE
jgi:hypothetical protein